MILPLPRTGPSRRCRLQLTTKIRLSSCSRPASVMAPSVSGSSVSPSPTKHHTLRPLVSLNAAVLEIFVKAGLIDGHDRPQAHRHRREFPEIGHQPRMRIARKPAAGG